MSTIDELLRNAATHAAGFDAADLPIAPARRLAIVACMDARLNPHALLGLDDGDAHLIRNAGGVVSADVIRSLSISQRLLGTEEIMVIQHTDCGMVRVTDDEFRRALRDDVGMAPDWAVDTFGDLDEGVRESIARIAASPFIPHRTARGFVYDVRTGALREVITT